MKSVSPPSFSYSFIQRGNLPEVFFRAGVCRRRRREMTDRRIDRAGFNRLAYQANRNLQLLRSIRRPERLDLYLRGRHLHLLKSPCLRLRPLDFHFHCESLELQGQGFVQVDRILPNPRIDLGTPALPRSARLATDHHRIVGAVWPIRSGRSFHYLVSVQRHSVRIGGGLPPQATIEKVGGGASVLFL